MGWERRGNGRYYYSKRREGGHVVSRYVGCGPVAQAIATLQAQDTRLRRAMQARNRHERAQDAALDAELARVDALVGALTAAVLLLNGCHTHKRQWRRRRNNDER